MRVLWISPVMRISETDVNGAIKPDLESLKRGKEVGFMDSTAKVRTETDREKALRLGSAIRTARREFGWSLGAVARAVGISVPHMSKFERGQLPRAEAELWFRPIMREIIDMSWFRGV